MLLFAEMFEHDCCAGHFRAIHSTSGLAADCSQPDCSRADRRRSLRAFLLAHLIPGLQCKLYTAFVSTKLIQLLISSSDLRLSSFIEFVGPPICIKYFLTRLRNLVFCFADFVFFYVLRSSLCERLSIQNISFY